MTAECICLPYCAGGYGPEEDCPVHGRQSWEGCGLTLPDPGPLASQPRSWLLVWDGGPDARHPYPFQTFEAADRFASQLAPEAHPNLRAVPWGVAAR